MRAVDIKDQQYPYLLKNINDAPERIYYKGKWDNSIFDNCLAVVGSRKMTSYGKQITDKLVSEIASAGVTIVSGFMYGVDAQAHYAALLGQGRTIAVMPCGINLIHPAYQKKLYRGILKKGGLVISELEGRTAPKSWSYPRRNRIVAGLSQATLVVEAAEKSGSLITADLTKRFNRKLFALPGPLTSSVSRGTLKLIKEGVSMVTKAEDILSYYKLSKQNTEYNNSKNSDGVGIKGKILEKLSREPAEVDVLSRDVGVSASRLGTILSIMEIEGKIIQEKRKYYVNS